MEQIYKKIELLANAALISVADKDLRLLKSLCFKIINIIKEVEENEKK